MQIDKSVSEKINFIKQLNSDLVALGSDVTIAEDESKITLTELTEIPDVQDDGTNDDIKPNTSIKAAIVDTQNRNHTTTIKFRRLSLEKKFDQVTSKDPNGVLRYEDSSGEQKEHNTFLGEANAKFVDDYGLAKDAAIRVVPVSAYAPGTNASKMYELRHGPISDDDFLNGEEKFSYQDNSNSIVTTGKSKVFQSLKVREDTKGEIRYVDEGNKISSYYPDVATSMENIDNKIKVRIIRSNYVLISLPKSGTEIMNEWAKGVFNPSGFTFLSQFQTNEELVRFGDDCFKGFGNGKIGLNFTVTTHEPSADKHLFSNAEYIGNNAFQGLTLDGNVFDDPIHFTKDNLEIGKKAFKADSDFEGCKFASFKAIMRVIGDHYTKLKGVKWTKHQDHQGEVDTAASNNELLDDYGYFSIKDDQDSTYTNIPFKVEDVTTYNDQFVQSDVDESIWRKVHKLAFPKTGDITVAANMFHGIKLNEVDSTLVIGKNVKVQGDAFKAATITSLVVKEDNEAIITDSFLAGSFANATINKITVQNIKIKEALEPILNSLTNTPIWTLVDSAGAPPQPVLVPENITANGFSY